LYCSAVSPDASASSDDSGSESSFVSNSSKELAQKQKTGWKSKLLQFSNIASMLCVLDCTVLPIVTIILPLFGIVAGSPAQMEWLHLAGHKIALGFVLPVGLLATISNYVYSHKTLWISMLGVMGLVLVVGANAGCGLVPHGVGGAVGRVVHKALHYLHHGIAHRAANLTGCGLLLFSNYLSHRKAHAAGTCSHGPACTHEN
jgi:putative flippase GtrA